MLALDCMLVAALTATPAYSEPVRFGARSGLTVASHSEEGGLIFGGTAGLLASIPIGEGSFMIEPALVFSMKGGGWGAGEGGEDKHYDYVEVPVLLRYGAKGSYFVGAGIAPALLVHEWHVSNGGTSNSSAKPFDLSVVGQVGREWTHFRLDLGLEVGIIQADDSHSDAPPSNKNRAAIVAMSWFL